jgi:hypothetical protein
MHYSCTIRCSNHVIIYVVCQCVQTLVISSKKVGWAKQGTCTLVDDEPQAPTNSSFASDEGWKEVTDVIASAGGADFLFPHDQLMLVLPSTGSYKPLDTRKDRLLGNLKHDRNYMVWYHHLLQNDVWKSMLKKKK